MMLHACLGASALCVSLLSSALAVAQETGSVETRPSDPGMQEHDLSLYVTSGVGLSSSAGRTIGGAGGGLGVRDTIEGLYLLQADLSYLSMLGNVARLRAGVGAQWRGVYSPAVVLSVSMFAGDQLRFLTTSHPTLVRGPAISAGVSIAPLRWSAKKGVVSFLELGIGVGRDSPSTAIAIQVDIMQLSMSI